MGGALGPPGGSTRSAGGYAFALPVSVSGPRMRAGFDPVLAGGDCSNAFGTGGGGAGIFTSVAGGVGGTADSRGIDGFARLSAPAGGSGVARWAAYGPGAR